MNLFDVGDQLALNFVHKRLLGAAKTFVTSGFSPLAAAGGFFAPAAPPVRRPPPRTTVARPSARSAASKEMGREVKFASAPAPTTTALAIQRSECKFPRIKVRNQCVDLTAIPPGGDPLTERIANGNGNGNGADVGPAVMGRFGAALTPGSRIVDRAVCLRGMVLGNDGLCYNSKGFRNGDRMWPRGRRPLLTGGEMRAISVASRAATRLTNAAVRLQDIGLIKKPVARRRAKKKS